jgi:hypothetical protein
MKCPDCGHKLYGIPPLGREEWVCDNPECPANKNNGSIGAGAEYYGTTQEKVNEMKRK